MIVSIAGLHRHHRAASNPSNLPPSLGRPTQEGSAEQTLHLEGSVSQDRDGETWVSASLFLCFGDGDGGRGAQLLCFCASMEIERVEKSSRLEWLKPGRGNDRSLPLNPKTAQLQRPPQISGERRIFSASGDCGGNGLSLR
ncbi:hypothetical protein CKAN_00688500 [Cinnamomum micranthum f. kanehirae]|uniref:Uncharacterized protein n=1 Tax=Cinnamomum micranthum f. kanehirae TaxID=337451 RepID=A0A3S3ML09_9MAGN|nr:hypothetical protein CKAN_00688500 [Cinnamomum micranthum f. kanehirae]